MTTHTITPTVLVPGTFTGDLLGAGASGGTDYNTTETGDFAVTGSTVSGGQGGTTRMLVIVEEQDGSTASVVFDAGDYPLKPTDELMNEVVQEFRKCQPTVVLGHTLSDPYNGDHPEAGRIALNARVYAQAAGFPSEHKKLEAPPLFFFEPHQPEMCGFQPQVLLDITSSFDKKRQAMECMEAQEHLWNYYTDLAKRRGTQAVRNSGRKEIKFAEAFQRYYPQVAVELT